MNSKQTVRGLSVLAICLLSACANFGKQVPLDNPTAYSLPAGQTMKAEADWWLALKDPKLNQYVAQALQSAPSLRIAAARLQQARAQIGQLEAIDKTQIGLNATGFGMYSGSKPEVQRDGSQASHELTLANVALQAKWSFDFWGKNRASVASVVGRQQAIQYEAVQTRLTIAQAVTAQYFAWQNLVAQQTVLQRRIDNAAAIEKLLQKRVDAKLLPPAAVYEVQQTQQQMKMQQSALARDAAKARHGLAVLVGLPPAGLDRATPAGMAAVPVVRVGDVRADLLGKRPDIAAQRALLSSRMSTIQAAQAEFYPNIELKLLAGLARIDAFDLVNSNSRMLGIVPAVSLPIFTSGALQSQLAGKRSEYNQQVAEYDQTVLDAMRSAADAVSDYQSSYQQWMMQRSVWETSRKAAASSLRRVQAGLDNRLVYLQKQDNVLQQQGLIWAQQNAGLTAWSNLQAQLGGGFHQDVPESAEKSQFVRKKVQQ